MVEDYPPRTDAVCWGMEFIFPYPKEKTAFPRVMFVEHQARFLFFFINLRGITGHHPLKIRSDAPVVLCQESQSLKTVRT